MSTKAMIISVGGTPEPIVTSLAEHRPEFVCFFASQRSIDLIGKIKDSIAEKGLSLQDYKVVCDDVNDLVHCYERAQKCADLVADRSVDPGDVVVDYTGGTKAMTAALALATVGHGYSFCYVGGADRTKDGLGVVVSGTEEVRTGVSPWQIFAVEEKQRISLFVSTFQYEAAIAVMRRTAPRLRSMESRIWTSLVDLLEGYLAWDHFNHSEAIKRLSKGLRDLEPFGDLLEAGVKGFLEKARENFQVLELMSRETAFFKKLAPSLLRDMLSNARRRALQGKYDDAVARLYRTLEMMGQIAFERETGCPTSDVDPARLPESLRDEYTRKYGDTLDGKLKMPLFATFRVLEEVGSPEGLAFAASAEEVRNLLAARNGSILAHGMAPVAGKTYEHFDTLLRERFVPGPLIELPHLEW